MSRTVVRYRAYLLRLWHTAETSWRASLEDAHTGERRAFATLAQLVAFLEQTPDNDGPDGDLPGTDGQAADDPAGP